MGVLSSLCVPAAELLKLVPAADQCYKTERPLPAGMHVLSVVQKGEKNINVGYLLYW